MPITFQCPNILYDQATQKRKRCGKKLRAPDDQSGITVKCPQCKHPLTIPSNSPPVAKTDVMDLDFDNDASAHHGRNEIAHDRILRCRKCGRPIDNRGVCVKCNYAHPNLKLAAKEIDDIKVKPAGFQLWMINILSEGMPVVVLTSMVHFLFAVLAVGAAALVWFSTVGLTKVAFMAALLAVVFFYVALVYKSYDLMRNPHARLAWFQRPFWDLVLYLARKRNWTNQANRVVIDKRGVPLTDDELDKLQGLTEASVLDLQGTQITDDAFRFFYRLDQLQSLVLKDTDVSHAAVFKLQQTKPKIWIWY